MLPPSRRNVVEMGAGWIEFKLQVPLECLNEHWFTSLAHARTVIENWRREYNEERPKKALGGLTPMQYARQLAANASTVSVGL